MLQESSPAVHRATSPHSPQLPWHEGGAPGIQRRGIHHLRNKTSSQPLLPSPRFQLWILVQLFCSFPFFSTRILLQRELCPAFDPGGSRGFLHSSIFILLPTWCRHSVHPLDHFRIPSLFSESYRRQLRDSPPSFPKQSVKLGVVSAEIHLPIQPVLE